MDLLTRYRAGLLDEMDRMVGGPPSRLLDMARYHLGLPSPHGADGPADVGKMLRPALALAVCEALGGSVDQCQPAALSLELIHRTSLVFDDMQDHSPERNHRPNVGHRWGIERGMNVGLYLSSQARLAFHEMSGRGVADHVLLAVHRVLETAVIDLCTGQDLDLGFSTARPSLDQYMNMVRLKTGALLGAACEVGALVAGVSADTRAGARLFGQSLGIAFQLRDDNMGVWGDQEVMGKAPNDVEERKRGLPVVVALELGRLDPGLLDRPPEDADATRAIIEALAQGRVKEVAESQVHAAAADMLIASGRLGLTAEWDTAMSDLTRFVVNRVA